MQLTEKDYKVYEFIKAFMLENNVTPSMQEIAEALGIKSLSQVHARMSKLIKAGLIIPHGDNSIRYFIKDLRITEVV
jgi:SOS-response transcriptional repressor LexA